MKKILTFLITLVFIFALTSNVHAAGIGTVNTLIASGTDSEVRISGTTTGVSAAVVAQVLDSDGNVLSMETFTVLDDSFSGYLNNLSLIDGAAYSVRVADYDGGSWTKTSFVAVASSKPEEPTEPTVPIYPANPSSPSNSESTDKVVVSIDTESGKTINSLSMDTYNSQKVMNTISSASSGSIVEIIMKESAIVDSSIIEKAIEKNINLVFEISENNLNYVVEIEATNLVEKVSSINLGLQMNANDYDDLVKSQNYVALEFAHSGVLPGKISFTIPVDFENDSILDLYYVNNNQLELVSSGLIVSDKKVKVGITHCSTYILKEHKELDLSAYTNDKLDVYSNSRVTSLIVNSDTSFTLNGYALINGVSCNKANSLWREIIFVNEENSDVEYAYRKQVTSVYNTFLNSNKTINPNGNLDYRYANYTVTVDINNVNAYKGNIPNKKMASGSYQVFIRVSDGKNGKLFPLKDVTLSDGTNMENTGKLPKGFEVIDEDRALRLVIE